MIPHQIYCDYLEDKGIDCRLLRTQEDEGIVVTSVYAEDYNVSNWCGSGYGFPNGDCEFNNDAGIYHLLYSDGGDGVGYGDLLLFGLYNGDGCGDGIPYWNES